MNCHHFVNQVSANSLLPIIAIALSCVSLIISLLFSYLSFLHNRKTVEPYLIDEYEENSNDERLPYKAYYIKNCGYGIAIVKSMSFKLYENEYHDFRTLFDKNFKISSKIQLSSATLSKGYIISPNEKKTLFKLCVEEISVDSYNELQEFLSKISFKLEYKSIYNRKKPLISESITSTIKH